MQVNPVPLAVRRRRAVLILVPVVLLVTGAHAYDAIRKEGLTVGAVVPILLSLILIGAILAGVLWWIGRAEAAPGGLEPEAAKRRARVFTGIGVAGAGVSALAAVLGATVARPRSAPAPFVGEGLHVASAPLHLALTVPADWERLPVAAQPGLDFVVQHAASGTVLSGAVLPNDDGDFDVDATLKAMLEGRRAKWGELFDVQWGHEQVAGRPARTLALTLVRADGRRRIKVIFSRRGAHSLDFDCAGPEGSFAESEKRCREVLDRIEAR
jgi:hypothetical protein